jgi:hypothetical protein
MTMIARTTTPTMIPVQGTSEPVVLVVVVVVELEESPVVVFGAVADEPLFAPLPIELFPAAPLPEVPGPVLVVVVVFELPEPPDVCANVIAGATARKRARRIKLTRGTERIFSP